jgi:type I restriction enzyme S subunit
MKFVKLYVESAPFQRQIDLAKSGVGIEHFGPSHLRRMWIALPSREEQDQIVGQVEKWTGDHSLLILKLSRQLGLLHQYRAEMLSRVVSGKLDVGEAAKNLPEDPDAADAVFEERLEELGAA